MKMQAMCVIKCAHVQTLCENNVIIIHVMYNINSLLLLLRLLVLIEVCTSV